MADGISLRDIEFDSAAREARYERVAIMVLEGMTEEAAEKYCDSKPWIYGVRAYSEEQGRLI